MLVATRKGEIKKTVMSEFEAVRRAGLIAMNLEEDDELIGAKLARADDDILMISANGQAIRFTVEELRTASRTSGGVRGIRLVEGDTLVSMNIATQGGELLVVTEKGYGKRTPVEEYPRHNRGGSGVLTARLNEKTGNIAAARVITERDSDLMIVSASGVVIRIDVSAVRVLSRTTQGTLVQNLGKGDTIVAISTTNGKKVDDESEQEDATSEGMPANGEGELEIEVEQEEEEPSDTRADPEN